MRVWLEDLKFQLAVALRAAGIGLAAVAWASALASEAQQSTEVRSFALVASAIVGVAVCQWFTDLPPSATIAGLLRPFERDFINIARERADGDAERMQMLVTRMATLAAVRMRRGGSVPNDHRAWLRTLARLVVLRQAHDERAEA
jgi:hypothetical protein